MLGLTITAALLLTCTCMRPLHLHSLMQVEYINLRGTSKDNPAVCKYTGNKYYSEDWHHAH
jgi:hypothetical protein